MKHLTVVAAALLMLSACGKQDAVPPAPTSSSTTTSGSRPEKMPNGEPGVITLKHILIAFKDTGTKATRSKDEAQKLAYELIGRAKAGEDFDKLMKEFSNDPGEGTYTQVNYGIAPKEGEFTREDGQQPFVKGFGDVAFIINIGEIGLAEYDAQASPFGWHIIKRIK